MKIALVAAEASGDKLAAPLIHSLKKRFPHAQFIGVAGESMQAAGCQSLFPMEHLSVMGLVEVIKHLPRLFLLRKQLKRFLKAQQPDIYIGIDAPDFNLPVEKYMRSLGVPSIHYVSPTVWAWRENRVNNIKASCDHVMGLFPFEADIFKKYDMPYSFVGHPFADRIDPQQNGTLQRQKFALGEQPCLAILPGSRASEVQQLLPIMLATAQQLQTHIADLHILIPAATQEREQQIQQLLNQCQVKHISLSRETASECMLAADAVLLSSGTATLEAMLCGKLMLSVYKMSGLTYRMMQRLYKPNYFSLPNILADELLIPELLQADVNPATMCEHLLPMLAFGRSSVPYSLSEKQISHFRYCQQRFNELHQQLRQNASERAADVIALYLAGDQS